MAIYESKSPTKDGRKYFFRIKYKDIMGVSHDYSSPKFKKRSEAIEEEAKYRLKVSGKLTNTFNPTIEEIYFEYIELKKQKFKPQTIIRNNYLFSHLEPLKKIKVNNFDVSKYRKFRSELFDMPFDSDYKNKIQGLLKALIVHSNKYYNTSDTIVKHFETFKNPNEFKKEMQFFTYEEYLKFDSVIENFMHHVFFELLYFMGLRQGEAQALTWEDIDLKKGTVSISKTLTTKIKGEKWTISSPKTKNSTRVLPLTNKLINDLLELKKQASSYDDFTNKWFIFGNSLCLPENTIQINKNKYCKLAGVKQIRVHDFRHSCASLLINKGASISLVSKYLGHANVSITLNTYTHMYKSELTEMTKILNNL